MLPIRTILCPTDFSPCSENAFHMACALARDFGARVLVVHVVPPMVVPSILPAVPPPPLEDTEEPRARLAQMTAPAGNVAVERLLFEGDPTEDILKVACERPCDLIVMGTHGRSGVGRLLMGGTAEAVLRGAPCPVLTLRASPIYVPAEEPVAAGAGSP
jgi:nucleotide-binding universal stress UspA family protein